MKNWRIKTVLVLAFIAWVFVVNAQTLGGISLTFPEDGHELTLREDKIFKWDCPDNYVDGNVYNYIIKIVKMERNGNPDDAIQNEAYFQYNTDEVDYTRIWFEKLDTVYFTSGQYFAWQVKAYSADTVFAESEAYWFKGPPPFEYFKSGSRTIYTTEFTRVDEAWDSLCGYGYTKLSNHTPAKTVSVYFENIKAEREGSYYYQRGGTIYGTYKDTFNIKLDDESVSITVPIYLDSLILTENATTTKCSFSPQLVIDEDTLTNNYNQWITLGSYDKPGGKFLINDTLIKNDQFIFDIADTSYIYLSDYKYYPGYYGQVEYVYQTDTFSFAIPDAAKNITYFSSDFENAFNLTEQLNVITSSCIVDCDKQKSPGAFNDSTKWQGLYFNNLGIDQITQDSTFVFKLTDNLNETVQRDSSAWLAYISNNKLYVDIDTTFGNPISNKYNYFNASYDHLKINNLNDTLEWDVTGVIEIPYLKDHDFNFSIPCKNSVIQLAETESDSEFQPFPLYEFELREFAFISNDGIDAIQGEIDHDKNKIEFTLPALETENDFYTLYTNFDVSAHNISINNTGIISGSVNSKFIVYDDISYELKLESYNNRFKNYNLAIDVEEAITSVNDLLKNNIKIYPNPFVDYIEISGINKGIQLQIIDINGKQIYQKIIDDLEKISLSNLSTGIYFIKLENNGEILSKKIIKL